MKRALLVTSDCAVRARIKVKGNWGQVMGREGRGLSVQVREIICDKIISLVKECEEPEEMMTRYTPRIL